MKTVPVRRGIAAGVVGMAMVLVTVMSAGPVAADGNGNCYATGISGQPVGPAVQCVPPAVGYSVNPYYVPAYAYPVTPYYAPVYYQPVGVGYAPGGCGVGYCGYTAAGPVVGYGPNGSTLVYDVRGGVIDAYTTDANGNVCEATTSGACQQTTGGLKASP